MSRASQDVVRIRGVGGVNQQTELADPTIQLASAINVYAPDGRIETRPGFVGVGRTPLPESGSSETAYGVIEQSYTPSTEGTFQEFVLGAPFSGSGVDALDANGEGDRFLFGCVSTADVRTLRHFQYQPDTNPDGVNSAETTLKVEYWNGTSWRWLFTPLYHSDAGRIVHFMAEGNDEHMMINPPGDWEAKTITTDVTDRTAYWLRVTPLGQDMSSNSNLSFMFFVATAPRPYHRCYTYPVELLSGKRYVTVSRGYGDTFSLTTSTELTPEEPSPETLAGVTDILEPPMVAEVPSFNEAFVCGTGFRRRVTHDGTIDEQFDETSEALRQVFGTAGVALTSAPKAKYVVFHDGALFFAGIEGEPYTVRWSAVQPYHRVFPGLNFEYLMEIDKSPITGLSVLGEYVVVFKRDSIWVMSRGESTIGASFIYTPVQVVSGIGCVASGSIQRVRNNLVFLAEDGLYAFDGTPTPKKLSDQVADFVGTIRNNQVVSATSANWSSRSLYLCSVPTSYTPSEGAGQNDTTLVYDYKNGSMFLWRGFEPCRWFTDEGSEDLEELYFTDVRGNLYRFGVGNMDHGAAISWELTTHRIGYADEATWKLNRVRILGNNLAREMTVTALRNDAISGDSAVLDFTDENEVEWGAEVTEGKDYVLRRRRNRRAVFAVPNEWFQIKVAGNTKNAPAAISLIEVGRTFEGVR